MTDHLPYQILFEDADIIAINKPAGILVHRTGISEDRVFILQQLRDQVGYYVYPVHRLDRGVSGVLLFAKSAQAAALVQSEIQSQESVKQYLAIVRGYTQAEGRIDHPLDDPHRNEPAKESTSLYKTLASCEMPWPIGRYQTSRYSLVELQPITGRTHQLRRHMAHLRHPILGDKLYGDLHHNAHIWQLMGKRRILLHALQLHFIHRGEPVRIQANIPEDYQLVLDALQFAY